MKKNFKSTALLYIFFCIGALLLLRGTSIYGRRKNYHEANAVFIKSTYHITKDSDGDDISSYWWHYKFYVNFIPYEAISKNHHIDKPLDISDIILYDIDSPSENMLKNDRNDVAFMVMGFIFIIIGIVCNFCLRINDSESTVLKIVGWSWIAITLALLLFIYSNSLCNFNLMLKESGITLVVDFIMVSIGVLILKRAHSPNQKLVGAKNSLVQAKINEHNERQINLLNSLPSSTSNDFHNNLIEDQNNPIDSQNNNDPYSYLDDDPIK